MITQKFSGEINGQKFDNVEEFKNAFSKLIGGKEEAISLTADDEYFTTRLITPLDEAVETVKLYAETRKEVSNVLEMNFEEDGLPGVLEDMDIEELKKLKDRLYNNLDKLDDFDLAVYDLSNLINDVILKQEELAVLIENELDKRIDNLHSQSENPSNTETSSKEVNRDTLYDLLNETYGILKKLL